MFFKLVAVSHRPPEFELDVIRCICLRGGGRNRGAWSASACRCDGRCGLLIEIEKSGEIGVLPWQLSFVRLFAYLGANFGKRVTDLHTGLGDILEQRTGERTIFALLAVKRFLARPGRKRNERAFARLHFGQARRNRDGAGPRGGANLVGKGARQMATKKPNKIMA